MKPTTLILLSCFLLFSGWFYWYQWRPSEIRKACSNKVTHQAEEHKKINDPLTVNEGNNFYRRCLAEQGMEAEDLVKSK